MFLLRNILEFLQNPIVEIIQQKRQIQVNTATSLVAAGNLTNQMHGSAKAPSHAAYIMLTLLQSCCPIQILFSAKEGFQYAHPEIKLCIVFN